MVRLVITEAFLFVTTCIFGQEVIKNRYDQQDEINQMKSLGKNPYKSVKHDTFAALFVLNN